MTEKQADKLRLKIKKIKTALAADKRRWGGFYDDSRGLRYLPPQYYVELGDWSEGLKYFKWFDKNFPDDGGFPGFLFEWTIILFKTDNVRQAEKKAFETFTSNTYVFDKFFGGPIVPLDKFEGSNTETLAFVDSFKYSHDQPELYDFSEWLDALSRAEKFVAASQKFIDICKRLKTEDDIETRSYLIEQVRQLQDRF